MGTIQHATSFSGTLRARVIRAKKAPLSWRLRNTLRWSYIWGFIAAYAAKIFSKIFGVLTMTTQLEARLIRATGEVINYGVVSRRVVTTAGVDFLTDDWVAGTADISNMKFMACGTGTGSEVIGDTALGAEATTITDRCTGTMTENAHNIPQCQGTQSFTNTGAITEHGVFSVVTEGSGVLWDRSQFAAINVGNGDSIQWTYQVTINAGG